VNKEGGDMWNKDEIEGKGKRVKGMIKEKVGELTGNEALLHEGVVDRAEGKALEDFGKARRKVNEKIEKIRQLRGY
jgi:uncharacterized protein YjbJ (UPF0337 family)